MLLIILAGYANAEIRVLNNIEDKYNINERISLQSSISYKEDLSGYIKANINCENNVLDYYVRPINFKSTEQRLDIPELTLTKNMLGKCSLNIILADLNSNLIDQSLVKLIDISDKLNLNLALESSSLNPGETLTINGNVKNIRNLDIKNSMLEIVFGDKNYEYNLDTSEFKKSFNLAENIKSGKHIVKVNIKDDYDNNAETDLEFYITPRPSDLKVMLNKIEFLPGENIELKSLLYDQANELIENDAEIKLLNSKGTYITQGYGTLTYILPQDALPGTWTIKATDSGFNIESKFIVKELKQIDIYLENGILYIRNLGNINYNDDILVKINGKEFVKKVDVKPNNIEEIDLSKKVDPGVYDVNVKGSDEEKLFSNVDVPESDDLLYITGSSIKNVGNKMIDKPYLLLILFALILVILYLVNKGKKINRTNRERDSQLAYMNLQRIKKERQVTGFKPKKFSELSNEELSDYRKQLLKNIKQEKKEEENPGYEYKPPKEPKQGGLFSMFD